MRHVIVEGPDGSGKSTLVDLLRGKLGLTLRDRACSSLRGPVNLYDWWVLDCTTRNAPGIYDRHPLISEPIYAPLVRKEEPQYPFNDLRWVSTMKKCELAPGCLMIWCLPPLAVVQENVQEADQMAGVVDNIDFVYAAYCSQPGSWPGLQIVYDYTRMNPTSVMNMVDLVMSRG